MKKDVVTDTHYDIGRGEIVRISRLSLLNKFIPLGHLGGGPGLRCLLVLFVVHRFGGLVFRILMFEEERLTRLYVRLRKWGGTESPAGSGSC